MSVGHYVGLETPTMLEIQRITIDLLAKKLI